MTDQDLNRVEPPQETECVIDLPNGNKICAPAYPADCDYVRVLHKDGSESYWHFNEWAEDPQVVMGAFIGAMNSEKAA